MILPPVIFSSMILKCVVDYKKAVNQNTFKGIVGFVCASEDKNEVEHRNNTV